MIVYFFFVVFKSQFYTVLRLLLFIFRSFWLWWSNDVFITDFSHSMKIACAQIISLWLWTAPATATIKLKTLHKLLEWESFYVYGEQQSARKQLWVCEFADRFDHAMCWRCRATNYRCKLYNRCEKVQRTRTQQNAQQKPLKLTFYRLIVAHN